ncbi:hypothetical protein ACH4UM_14090 [Streptomyces sp. NPDC020801]|uniref:hypothetical protein n=1 Tax=unclassified Streptomyces TaxID=2593676 RepID=UPI00379CD5FC
MARRLTTLRNLMGAAVLPLALVTPAWGRPGPPRAAVGDAPATLCAPAGVLRGAGHQWASVSLCTGVGAPVMAVFAAALCGYPATKVRYACRTWGSWSAARDGATVAAGTLPGPGGYPGPGTYEVTASLNVRSAPPGVDLSGTVHATLTLTAPTATPAGRAGFRRQT